MIDKIIQTMDDTYADWLAGDVTKDKFLKKLSQVVSSLPLDGGSRDIRVNIVNQPYTEPFFGFRMYAVEPEMNKILNQIVNEKVGYKEICNRWKNIKSWYMEIDAQVFDRTQISLTPKELSAMTMHEIGHIIYSTKPMEYFFRAYTESKARIRSTTQGSLKILYTLYTIPLAVSCMQKSWVNGRNEISEEFFADSYLKNFGYTESLLSAITKIIKVFGSMDEADNTKVKTVENAVDWCNMNIADLERRKNTLKDELFQKSVRTSSPFFKGLCLKQLRSLGVKLRERFSGSVVEATLDNTDVGLYQRYEAFYDIHQSTEYLNSVRVATESYIHDFALESTYIKLPNQSKIDQLAVEADRITSHSDRIYVLDLIYRESMKLEAFRDKMGTDKQLISRYKTRVDAMARDLEAVRAVVLSKHSFNKEYKFFVKYPNGYEG